MRRFWIVVLALPLVGLIASASTWSIVRASASPWVSVATGVERLERRDDPTGLSLWRFDLSTHRADVAFYGADHRVAAETARRSTAALLAVNGGFFDEHWQPLGLRVAQGRQRVPLRPHVDWGVLLLREGRASIVHSSELKLDNDVVGAIQVGPRLVVDGQPLRLKPQSARRTLAAVDRSGRWLTLGVTRAAVDARALAEQVASLGFHSAILLDGGPSTQLSADVASARQEVPGGYAVPDLVLVRRRP